MMFQRNSKENHFSHKVLIIKEPRLNIIVINLNSQRGQSCSHNQKAFIQICDYLPVQNISGGKTFSAKTVIKSLNGVLDAPVAILRIKPSPTPSLML